MVAIADTEEADTEEVDMEGPAATADTEAADMEVAVAMEDQDNPKKRNHNPIPITMETV
jgi:hypothetical protein